MDEMSVTIPQAFNFRKISNTDYDTKIHDRAYNQLGVCHRSLVIPRTLCHDQSVSIVLPGNHNHRH